MVKFNRNTNLLAIIKIFFFLVLRSIILQMSFELVKLLVDLMPKQLTNNIAKLIADHVQKI